MFFKHLLHTVHRQIQSLFSWGHILVGGLREREGERERKEKEEEEEEDGRISDSAKRCEERKQD